VIQFLDEKGEMRFTVKLDNVIYIESSDNYVNIKYNNNGKISDFLLRNSLKKLSENFSNTPLQRCHRSYMVNFNHVVSMRRHSGEMFLEFDVPDTPEIPVSKTFSENTLQFFMKGQAGKS
jgi:Response regulator of the LytR/AlgR family